MCDTMVCLPNVTKNGKMIFAKNSDRSPNEPHIIERIPAKTYDIAVEPYLKTTYIEIEQAPKTYAVTLFKPSWLWGAEMGFNEYGLNIGNEAVFTKMKRGKDALLGMDLLRLALERNKTAYDALFCITDLLAKYGQGGNCGYQKNFYYDNSYLIADHKEAYVLETAGEFWAAKRVEDIYAISNGLTIEGDFDYSHPVVMAERESNANYSFKKKYKEPIFTFFAQSKGRREAAESVLRANAGQIEVETLMNILRCHKTNQSDVASVGSVCMHAGGRIGDHTTGAYIAELSAKDQMYYATGASLPCLSIFKPMIKDYVEGDFTNKGISYWYQREKLIRYFLAGQADKKSFREKADKIEKDMLFRVGAANDKNEIKTIIKDVASAEQALIDEYLGPIKDVEHQFKLGKGYYRKFWTKKTKKLIEDLSDK